MDQHFIIRCRVSGGPTGTRESIMHDSGRVTLYPTREAAQAVADEYSDRMNGNPYRTATFQYWVEPYEL